MQLTRICRICQDNCVVCLLSCIILPIPVNSLQLTRLRSDSHGGAEGIRTPDLFNAIEALSQLSYSPIAIL